MTDTELTPEQQAQVLALAQEIRRVDGKHDKGAAELAEALVPFMLANDSEEPLMDVRILVNRNVTMTPGKMAAQAVHAALLAYGIDHGRVVVLKGSPNQVKALPVQVQDAGRTEIESGTLTCGAVLEPSNE